MKIEGSSMGRSFDAGQLGQCGVNSMQVGKALSGFSGRNAWACNDHRDTP